VVHRLQTRKYQRWILLWKETWKWRLWCRLSS